MQLRVMSLVVGLDSNVCSEESKYVEQLIWVNHEKGEASRGEDILRCPQCRSFWPQWLMSWEDKRRSGQTTWKIYPLP